MQTLSSSASTCTQSLPSSFASVVRQSDVLSLDECKQLALDMLVCFDAFCAKYKLRYWLSDGSLLGAVRHGGFIPWDDDIDVCMPCSDYHRFLQLHQSFINESQTLDIVAFELSSDYYRPWARIFDTRTEVIDGHGAALGQRCDMDVYPFIDVFPLIEFSSHSLLRTLKAKRIELSVRLLSQLTQAKPRFTFSCKSLAKHAARALASVIGQKRIMQWCCSYQNAHQSLSGDTGFVAEIYGTITSFIPACYYQDTCRITFEGQSFNAPRLYEQVLEAEYGNWKQEPDAHDKHIVYETKVRFVPSSDVRNV